MANGKYYNYLPVQLKEHPDAYEWLREIAAQAAEDDGAVIVEGPMELRDSLRFDEAYIISFPAWKPDATD